MKRKLMTLVLTLCLALSLVPTAKAFDSVAARHGVVRIYVGDMINGFRPWVTGSGFFVGKDGENPSYLVTNYHVVEAFIDNGEGAISSIYYTYTPYGAARPLYLGQGRMAIRVYFDDNTFSEAYPVDHNEVGDFAVLRLSDPTDKRAALPVMLPTEEMVGSDKVYAIGYPSASENVYANPVSQSSESDSSVTDGTISRRYTESGPGIDYLQTTAQVQGGNSGGPLVHENGAVVGINTSIYRGGTDNIYNVVSMKNVVTLLDKNNIPYVLKEYGSEPEPEPDATYTLTLDNGEGAENGKLENTGNTGSFTFTLPAAPTREGYTFKGWAESAGGTPTYLPGGEVTLSDAAKTLYAVWEQTSPSEPVNTEEEPDATYTLTLDNGEGAENGKLEDTNNTGSATFTLPAAPTREGYTFKGWAESANGTPSYLPGGEITLSDAAKTLYAVWEQNAEKSNEIPVWGIVAAVVAAAAVIAAAILLSRKKKPAPIEPSIRIDPTLKLKPTEPAPSADTDWRVQGIAGALEGKRFMIRSSGTVLMGRDPQAGIAFPANTAGVSGRHCELWYEDGSVYLRDVGSSNGTFVAGARAAAHKPVRLKDGDMFWLGSESEKFILQKKR